MGAGRAEAGEAEGPAAGSWAPLQGRGRPFYLRGRPRPQRPSTSPTLGRRSSPTLAPLGAAPRRRRDPAGGRGRRGQGVGGSGEGAGPGRACRGAGSSGRCGGGGGGCGPRGPSAGGVGTAGRGGRGEGEGGEPLPILGRSRRRRRPAVGESKVVAGRHFGIFPQPAGHCGGHGESGPMAGGQP